MEKIKGLFLQSRGATSATVGLSKDKPNELVQGLKDLFPSDQAREIYYDVVAVPGLGADPAACWKDSATGFNWITGHEGLHEEFPNARILLYQYASAWQGRSRVQSNFDGIAHSLLTSLNESRKASHEKRPIVFIGHSMGGLVIAKALCLAEGSPSLYPGIVTHVTSCICFGTPFLGAEFANLYLKWNIMHMLEHDSMDFTGLLDLLVPNNPELVKLTIGFKAIVERMDPQTTVLCFWEQQEMDWAEHIKTMQKMQNDNAKQSAVGAVPISNSAKKKILADFKKNPRNPFFVTRESAILSPETGNECGMTRSHKKLVQFTSKDDSDYTRVLGLIRPLLSGAEKQLRTRQKAQVLNEYDVSLIKHLFTSGVNMRVELQTVSHSSAKNNWLIGRPEFTQWRNSSNPISCLWIEGPPGYGKTAASVATTRSLAEAIQGENKRASHRTQKTLYACFFCSDKPGCSTTQDLLKSILLQLIDDFPKLATYAEDFLDQDHRSKVSLTIENMWDCLKDMLEDVSLHAVYIIVNNIHRLEQDESLETLLEKMKYDFSSTTTPGRTRNSCHFRWFFTAFSKFRDNISRSLSSTNLGSNVRKIDLEDGEIKPSVKQALAGYVREKANDLKTDKGYNQSLAFEVEEILESKAENKHWVDVACLQLGTLDPSCNRLLIRDRLEAAARGDLKKLVKDSWEWIFVKMNPDTKTAVQDVLRALVLLVTEVTLEECSILTGYATGDLEPLIKECAPMLTIEGQNQQIKFGHEVVKDHLLSNWASLLASPGSNPSSEEVTRQQRLQHGYLAWRCFIYIDTICAPVPVSIRNTQGTETMPENGAASITTNVSGKTHLPHVVQDDADKLEPSTTSTMAGIYPVQNWRHHVIRGGEPVAQSLYTGLPQFWGSIGSVRTEWLRDYTKEWSEFKDLSTTESMSALHVACGLGLRDLSNVLLTRRRDEEIYALDGNYYTPLHLAAFNNHIEIVELLLNYGADIKASSTIASPLHLAAVGGHVKVMELLLNSQKDSLSNVNAKSEIYGPVINAAIRSGVVRAVKMLLDHQDFTLDLDSNTESPLALAALTSAPEVFHKILHVGLTTWTQEHYEQALETASLHGRIECVNAIITSSQPLGHEIIEQSVLVAGLKDHWEVVARLLDLAPRIDYGNIFFLAAATLSKQSQDHVLKRIWRLALSKIPQNIRNAALYRATDHEKKSTVEWLLTECHANPNATADKPAELAIECVRKFPLVSYGDALTAAAYDGNLELIRVLLSHKASVNSKDGAALQTAALQGHLDAVDLLLEHGADINRVIDLELMEELAMRWKSGTALQVACDYGHSHIVKRLLDRQANPNLSHAKSYYTYPIISATATNQPEILKYLLDVKETDVKVRETKDGLSPLHLACEHMDLFSVQRLLDRGADIDAVDLKGNQALHMAASKGDAKVVSFLLKHNAKVSHISKEKGLALQEALRKGHQDCAMLLADAAVPIFDSLTYAAEAGNGFAESVLRDPKCEHPRLDTKKIAGLEHRIEELQERNEQIERTLEDYNGMKDRVEESDRIAKEKVDDANKARAELADTHSRFDISIAGFDSVRAERDESRSKLKALELKFEGLREQGIAQEEKLQQQSSLSQQTASELQESQETLFYTQDLLKKEKQQAQALRAEIDELRNGTAPRGSVFSTNSSEAFDPSTHRRQSSMSTDRLDAVSLADSDHPASGKERKGTMAKFSKYSKNSISSMSSGMADFGQDAKAAWQKRKKVGD